MKALKADNNKLEKKVSFEDEILKNANLTNLVGLFTFISAYSGSKARKSLQLKIKNYTVMFACQNKEENKTCLNRNQAGYASELLIRSYFKELQIILNSNELRITAYSNQLRMAFSNELRVSAYSNEDLQAILKAWKATITSS